LQTKVTLESDLFLEDIQDRINQAKDERDDSYFY